MSTSTNFDRLVNSLSSEERREMLEKLNSVLFISEEPLIPEQVDEYENDIEKYYHKLGFFQKLVLFLKSIFKGKEREEVVRDHLINTIASKVITRYPGLIDPKNGVLLPGFFRSLEDLKNAADYFSKPVSRIFGPGKKEFIAFLTGLELPTLQRRVLDETDPESVKERNPELELVDIKRSLDRNLKENLESISSEDRKHLYKYSKILNSLYMFTTFPFTDLIDKYYSKNGDGVGYEEILDTIMQLAAQLHALRQAPPPRVLEAVFIFLLGDKVNDQSFDLANELNARIRRAGEEFERIRRFNRNVPLVDIIRVFSGSISYSPEDISGGEDWYALLCDFHQERLKKKFANFSRKEELSYLRQEARNLTGTDPSIAFHCPIELESLGIGTHLLSIGFLKSFFQSVFLLEMNNPLKILLIEGIFYKGENREDYTDVYNNLLKMPSKLENIEASFAEEGAYNKEARDIREEISPVAVKRKKMNMLAERIKKELYSITSLASHNLSLLSDILNGILFGEVGGKYDTISNLGQIEGRNNKSYLRTLERIMTKTREAVMLLSRITEIEKRIESEKIQ